MNHISEEQLILHYYGEGGEAGIIDRHLDQCADCRASYNALRLVLNTVDSAPVPERRADYGSEVWSRLAPQVKVRRRWPRWLALVPATAMMLALAFFAGRMSQKPAGPQLASGTPVRERILLVAVGDHLDRSQMILAEISNAPDGKGKIDISSEQQAAGELLDDNRLYRQTARTTGDTAVASVLDDLERFLLEVSNGPSQVSSAQLDQLRQEIRDRGLLFKVRVIGSQVRERESVKTGKKL